MQAAPDPQGDLHEKLAALEIENAYLREMVGSLKSLGADHLKLLQQIGDLERQVVVLKSRRAEEVVPGIAAGSAARVTTGRAGAPKDAARRSAIRANIVATAAKIQPSDSSRKRVLIVGPPLFQRESWRLFGHSELTDLVYGVSDTAAVRFIGGPLPPVCLSDFAPLERRYEAQAVEFRGLGPIDETLWSEAIHAAADHFEPDLLLFVDMSPVSLKALSRLPARARTRTVLICSRGQLAAAAGESLDGEADLVKAASRADLVLTTSRFEKSRLSRRLGSDRKVQVYLRGVDLTRFKPEAKSAPDRAVFVADRTGPAGLQCFYDAAGHHLANSALRLELFSAQPSPGAGFTARPLPGRNERHTLYTPGTVVIIPPECSGFSQVLMEGLASGCVCLVPNNAFAAQEGQSGAWQSYEPTGQGLAASLTGLLAFPDQVQRIQNAAFDFSRAALARSVWAARLREAVFN